MAEAKIRIRIKRGTSLEWFTNNPVLGLGEIGWITDTGRWFCGDGVSTYIQHFDAPYTGENVWVSESLVDGKIASQLAPLITDISNIQIDLSALSSDVANALISIATLQGDVASLSSDLAGALIDITNLEAEDINLQNQIDNIPLVAIPYSEEHITAYGNQYLIGDVVYYDGQIYKCKANNDGIIPTDPAYWFKLGAGYPLVESPIDWNSSSGNNQILNKPTFVEGITDDGNGVVSINNTDPANPIVSFSGVKVDNVTIQGSGTTADPLNVIPSGVESVSDDGQGIVNVDNTDPLNPIVGFGGVYTDGITMGGNGTAVSPLSSMGTDTYLLKATATDGNPSTLDSKIACTQDSSIIFTPLNPSGFEYIDARVNWSPRIVFECKNTDSVVINRGDPVYIMGMVGATNVFQVGKADASNPLKMPSVGVAENDMLVNGSSGIVAMGSFLQFTTDPIDGVTPTPNQTLYVKAGGGLTTTKPTGTNLIQNIGKVGKVSGGGSGSIIVSAIMRTNDLPNIATGKIWIGNADSVPTAQTLSGDATISTSGVLTVSNDAVTYAKIQNVSTDKRLLGRVSVGAGDIEEIELSADGTLGGAGASGSIVSSQAAVKNYVDVGLGTKQDTLVSGTNIKTINGLSILGSGDLDTGYTLKVQALTSAPTDGQTIYFGTLPKAPVTTANISKVYIPRAGIIKRVEIYSYAGTAGTAESWSMYIRLNNTTDTLVKTLAVNTAERRWDNSALNISVVAGDYVEIKLINPTWATNPNTIIFGGHIYIE